MDFTLKKYKELIQAFENAGYLFQTLEQFVENPIDKVVVIRHDIDKKTRNVLKMAILEKEKGLFSTYFFRPFHKTIFDTKMIKNISALGHEIGYHYRDFVVSKGKYEIAINQFQQNLHNLRLLASVRTIAMDGCPTSKYDNKSLWGKYKYQDYGIIGEPYFDVDFNQVLYLTDTGRTWNNKKYNRRDKVQTKYNYQFNSTTDIIKAIQLGILPNQILITTHPQRWTNNIFSWFIELISQSLKNRIKQIIVKY